MHQHINRKKTNQNIKIISPRSKTSVSLYILLDIYKHGIDYKGNHQISEILFSK